MCGEFHALNYRLSFLSFQVFFAVFLIIRLLNAGMLFAEYVGVSRSTKTDSPSAAAFTCSWLAFTPLLAVFHPSGVFMV